MPTLYGREIDKQRLLESVGDMSQVCGIQSCTYDDGPARGVRALEFRNPSGFRFTALPDRCMDIGFAEYRGVPLSWMSGTGAVSPAYYSAHEWDWLRGFAGGLLVTCGLSNVGDPCVDRGTYQESESFGGHGRISNTPARNVSFKSFWDGDRYLMRAEGEMIEAAAQGENFRLSRAIETEMGTTSIRILDTVENRSFRTVPHMFLYHMNIGYPLLGETSEIHASCKTIRGLTKTSEDLKNRVGVFGVPSGDAPELVYLLDLVPDGNGDCNLLFANRIGRGASDDSGPGVSGLGASGLGVAGLGIALKFQKTQFPYFNLWKQLNRGEYVVGLEPGNCTVQGRVEQRKRGDLRELKPRETTQYDLEISVMTSNGAIEAWSRANADAKRL
jgi:hypothetical protein